MIHEIDEALRVIIRAVTSPHGEVEVAFDAPTEEWSNKRQGPAVNCYLYSVRENLELRSRQWNNVPRGDGTVEGHRRPPRQYKLSYMVTVWGGRPEDEHRILATLIDGLASQDVLTMPPPADPAIGDPNDVLLLPLAVALPQPQDRPFPDVWGSLKTVVRPALDLIVTAPFGPRAQPAAPPVTEPPRLDMFDTDGDLLDVAGKAVDGEAREAALTEDTDRRSAWPVDTSAFSGELVGPRRPRPVRRPQEPEGQ